MEKKARPVVIKGSTTRYETGCGHIYITLNYVGGKLFEVFAKLGKSGGCAMSQLEALTRLVTLALRYDIPPEEIIKQLSQLKCPSPGLEDGEQIFSCADAIAKVLSKKETTLER